MDVSQYLDIFIDETSGHIQSLSDNIMELEKEPENKDVVIECSSLQEVSKTGDVINIDQWKFADSQKR